jgi:phage tail tape-measure protein
MTMADRADANRDPITGEPGAHPVGTGAGAAAGGATGAAIGAIGGPVGAVVGGAVGAVVGGLAGKGAAEKVNPTVEDTYWRENYRTRPYAKADMGYETYQPAYRYGWESRSQYAGKSYDEVETDLERGWDNAKGTSKMAWGEAKEAVRDAWHRVDGNPRT